MNHSVPPTSRLMATSQRPAFPHRRLSVGNRLTSPADALEALVEAAVGAVLFLADEPPHAHRQGDDQGRQDIRITSRQPVPLVVTTGRSQDGHKAAAYLPGHVHDGPASPAPRWCGTRSCRLRRKRKEIRSATGSGSSLQLGQAEAREPGPPYSRALRSSDPPTSNAHSRRPEYSLASSVAAGTGSPRTAPSATAPPVVT